MQLNFDATNVLPADDFSPLPAGDYLAIAIDSEIKQTKSGTGAYLSITFQVADGQYINRLIWGTITLSNANPKAVEIGQRQLSALCHAVGVLRLTDSAQLHNIPVKLRLSIEDKSDGYKPRNNIEAYKPANANPAPQPFQPAQQVNQAQQPAAPAYQPAPQPTPAYQPPPAPQQAARPPWMK